MSEIVIKAGHLTTKFMIEERNNTLLIRELYKNTIVEIIHSKEILSNMKLRTGNMKNIVQYCSKKVLAKLSQFSICDDEGLKRFLNSLSTTV